MPYSSPSWPSSSARHNHGFGWRMLVRSKILIVDDEPFNVDYLEQELEDLGYETVSAGNGKEAVDKVASEPPELAKHEGDVSVLFVDISGYTSLSDRLRADVLNALVERYFSTFLDHIRAAGGDINETAGDGFMAIFQDAEAGAHAVTAIDSALALLGATEALNRDNIEYPLSIHIGVNSAVALVGSTRFEGVRGARWTFTASGPVTNLAARLAAAARAGQILAGPET